MTWLRRFVLILGGLILLLFASIAAILASETGTRFLIAQTGRFIDLQVTDPKGTPWSGFSAARLNLRVDTVRIEAEDLELTARFWPLVTRQDLDIRRLQVEKLSITVEQDGAPSESPNIQIPLLPVALLLDSVHINKLEWQDSPAVTLEGTALTYRGRKITAGDLQADSELWGGKLQGDVGQRPTSGLSLDLKLAWRYADWHGSGDISGEQKSLHLNQQWQGFVSGSAHGTLDASDLQRPLFDLQAEIPTLDLSPVVFENVALQLRGPLDAFDCAATGDVRQPWSDTVDLRLKGTGGLDAPFRLAAQANPLAGAAQGDLTIEWRNGFSISGNLDLQRLQLADLKLSDLRTPLEGELSTQGGFSWSSEKWNFHLPHVEGIYRGLNLTGHLTANGDGARVQFDDFGIEHGKNRVQGNGQWNAGKLQLEAEVSVPNLGAYPLQIDGDARLNARLNGAWPQLSGDISLESKKLGYAGQSVSKLTGKAVLDRGGISARLDAKSLLLAESLWHDPQVRIDGRLDKFQLAAKWGSGSLQAQVEQKGDDWLLDVEPGSNLKALTQVWTLDRALKLSVGSTAGSLSPHCWQNDGSKICSNTLQWDPNGIRLQGEAEIRDRILQMYLPVPVTGDGYLQGSWKITRAGDKWTGQSMWQSANWEFQIDEQDAVKVPPLSAQLDLRNDTAQATLVGDGEGISVNGDFKLQDLWGDRRIAGNLRVALEDLDLLRLLDRRVDSVAGTIEMDGTLTGTLADPVWQAQFDLRDGKLSLIDPQLKLKPLQLHASLNRAGEIRLQGMGEQAQGKVTMEGEGYWQADQPLLLAIRLEGEDLRASTPDWQVRLSPSLQLKIEDQKTSVEGRIVVPMARVVLASLPESAPQSSPDVVVEGRQEMARETSNRVMDVTLALGDDVQFKAAGIDSGLKGRVRMRTNGRDSANLQGKLSLVQGTVEAEGQTLIIESGALAFSGPPLNPFVDLRAARQIPDDNVKVGLHIWGPLQHLQTELYSDPAMSQTRALSYLVLGRDLEATSDNNGDNNDKLMSAAVSLGLSQTGGVVRELRQGLGLDDLSAGTNAEGNVAVAAGKYLTRNLYVRYTYDAITALSAMLLRYRLSARWHLEANAGERSSVDLLYRVDQ